ncbi:MAG: thioredoxin family protein [Gemmataceae bacterium]|nr:thioredoxin family protein [Gemmataceae bacterium]
MNAILLCLLSADDGILRAARLLREGDADGWRRMAWAASLDEAVAAARRGKRPLMVFSHEGNIDTGRC